MERIALAMVRTHGLDPGSCPEHVRGALRQNGVRGSSLRMRQLAVGGGLGCDGGSSRRRVL
jgi:hypothetical protein